MIPDPYNLLPSDAVRPFTAHAGDVLFRTGQAGTSILCIETGTLALVRVSEDGHAIRIAKAGPSGTLAEASIFSDQYHCDCVALTRARGVVASGAAIRALLRSDPSFAEAFVRRLAQQVRDERQRVEIMSIRSARERVYAALSSFGQVGTVTAFAAGIGLTQEACSRALAGLVAEGRVTRIGRGRYACL